jgi:hypothetical protein
MRTLRLGLLPLLLTAALAAVPPGAGAQRRGGIIRVGATSGGSGRCRRT